jgi:hypothetical protein
MRQYEDAKDEDKNCQTWIYDVMGELVKQGEVTPLKSWTWFRRRKLIV